MTHTFFKKGVANGPFFSFLAFLTLVLFMSSCEADTDIDSDLQQPGSSVGAHFSDTFSVKMRTVRIDSVRSDQNFRMPLGEYQDPVFGLNKASLVTGFQLSIPGVDLSGAGFEYDSLVLSLAYGTLGQEGSFYSRKSGTGNIDLDPQTFRVYELEEGFDLDDTIFSDGTVRNGFVKGTAGYNDQNPVGEAVQIRPKVGTNDSVVIGNEAFPPHLRIKLNEDFGKRVMNAGAGVYGSEQAFNDFLPGLVVVPENNYTSEKGQILYINPNAAVTRMTLYYRNVSGSEDITEQYEYNVNDDAVRFNLFDKDYTGTDVQNAIEAPGTGNYFAGGEENGYIQGLSGTRIELHVPHLLEGFEGREETIINEAELLIPTASESGGTFPPITQFNIAALTENGNLTVVSDYSEGFSHLDGFLNEQTGYYRFNLTRQVQRLLTEKQKGNDINYGFVIVPASEPVTAARTVLNGFNPKDGRKPKLNITYTPLNE